MSLYVFSCVVVACISIFLTAHCKYEDGVIGKFSLATIAVGCLIVFGEWLNDVDYKVNETTLVIQLGLMVFLTRHAYRFLKWRKTGANDWRKNETSNVSSDVVCPLLTSPRGKNKPGRKRNPDVLKRGSGKL